MKDKLYIKKIEKKRDIIKVYYELNGKWNTYIKSNEYFFSKYDELIENVPDSIAIIPFLCNILPISWVFNLEIEVDELDRTFYNSIEQIKNGYKEMYPDMEFQGGIFSKRLCDFENNGSKKALLFSGGVDAYCTLLRHFDEKPDLITVFGADIKLDDKNGIENVEEQHKRISEKLNLGYKSIYTNLKEFLNDKELSDFVYKKNECGWWHDFQHGIGLIGLVAPLSYLFNYEIVYIASSFCITQKGTYCSASDPIIDDNVKYGNTKTIHDGYELNRQDKIDFICKEINKRQIDNIELRVCWESTGGNNCCCCEKCYRTIMGILVEKEDPNKFGFDFNKKARDKMIKYLSNNLKINTKNGNIINWQPIQDKFLINFSIKEETPKDLIWFRVVKIGSKNKSKVIKKIKEMAKDILNVYKPK